MWTLDNLIKFSQENATETAPGSDKWCPARPMIDPVSWRLRDAWAVLIGKADAVKWPANQ